MDYFIGVKQSKYSAIAIFSAIFVICIAILFTNTDIPFSSRLSSVIAIFLLSIIPVFMSLFELTCIVTGKGKNGALNPCGWYAWIVAALIIVYCFILIIITIVSMFTYKKAIVKLDTEQKSNKISDTDANTIAQNMIVGEDKNVSHGVVASSQINENFFAKEVKEMKDVKKEVKYDSKKDSTDIKGYLPVDDYMSFDDKKVDEVKKHVVKSVPKVSPATPDAVINEKFAMF